MPSPIREDDPRSGSPEQNFYFPQEDFLSERQRGQRWTWNVIRPQAIIGHTLKPNGMNSALTYAIYLLICKELGEEARMPTNQLYWNQMDECSDAGLLAQLTIWASTTPSCANQAFNAVNGDHYTWKDMWPRLAGFIGAQATSEQCFAQGTPQEGEVQQEFSLSEWSKDKRPVWDRLCDKAGMPEAKGTFDAATWQYQDWVFQRTWSSLLAMTKAREFGWMGCKDSYECIVEAFECFKELRQIP